MLVVGNMLISVSDSYLLWDFLILMKYSDFGLNVLLELYNCFLNRFYETIHLGFDLKNHLVSIFFRYQLA